MLALDLRRPAPQAPPHPQADGAASAACCSVVGCLLLNHQPATRWPLAAARWPLLLAAALFLVDPAQLALQRLSLGLDQQPLQLLADAAERAPLARLARAPLRDAVEHLRHREAGA